MSKFKSAIDYVGSFFRKEVTLSILSSAGWGFSKWGIGRQMRAYERSTYVHNAVKKRGEKVGQVKWTLKRGETDITDHWVLRVLNRPNDFQTKDEFWALYQTYKDLTGSAFIVLIRAGQTIKEMHLVRPDRITVNIAKDGSEIVSYEVRKADGTKIDVPKEDMIASHFPSPIDQMRGLSALTPGSNTVDTEQQLKEYQAKVLKNGGKVEGILKFGVQKLSEAQIEKIKDNFAAHYANASNAGKPLVTYGDGDYKNLGLTPTELSYLDSLRMTKEDIYEMFGINKFILGDTNDVNLANARMAKTVFLSETIKPLLDNLTTKLDWELVPKEYDLGYIDPTPEDVEMRLKEVESGIKNYYMTINEARVSQGLDEIVGGDIIWQPFALVPQGAGPIPITDPEQSAMLKKTVESFPHPLKDADMRKAYHKHWIKVADAREKVFVKTVQAFFGAQLARILAQLENSPAKSIFEDVSALFNLVAEADLAKEGMLPQLAEFLKESGQDAMLFVGFEGTFSFNADVLSTLTNRAAFFTNKMSDTTFADLVSTFQDSASAGEDRPALMRRIRGVYDGYDKSRAQTVARTEVLVASQTGTMAGYAQAGVPIKIWTAVMDSATRDSHAMIDGEEQLMGIPFSNGLMFPGDPSGPAEEVINCRCTV